MRTALVILLLATSASASSVNVNIASAAQLATIMHEADAGRVAAYRRHVGGFTSCEQLQSVLSVSCDGVRFVGPAIN